MVKDGEAVVGYTRVSRQEQKRSGLGLEAQRRAIVRACEDRGWELLRIEEDVQSGARGRRRPGLERALAACKAGEAQGIIAAKLDRLTRSTVNCGELLDRAKRDGWNLVALDFGLDLSTSQGRLVANVLASVAQWERERIGERIAEAHAITRSRGGKLGRESYVTPKIRTRIKRMHRAGKSLRQIGAALDRDRIPTALGGQRWYASTVRDVLTRVPQHRRAARTR